MRGLLRIENKIVGVTSEDMSGKPFLPERMINFSSGNSSSSTGNF
jgi:hypothetical protein